MNAVKIACASSASASPWNQMDWGKYERQVSRLQARIVKATREGRWGKVKALQWLLTHSFSGKALAVRRVTGNQGKDTAGVDGAVAGVLPRPNTTPSLRCVGAAISRNPYDACTFPKAMGNSDRSGIPTMKDRAMQALYLLALDPVAETLADRNSYGFRVRTLHWRTPLNSASSCQSPERSPEWVLEGDIQGCFDHISHDWMRKHVLMDAQVLWKWLKCGYVEKRTLFATEEGTPQGGVISPTLANIVLDGLEALLKENFPRKNLGGAGPSITLKCVWYDMRMTSLSPVPLTRCWKKRSDRWSSASWPSEGCNSRRKRLESRISTRGLIFWASMFAATVGNF